MNAEQLSLEPDVAGYYSWWAETKNRSSGSGAVTWHENAEAARARAIESFDRGYRSWPEDQRPRAEVVRVELLKACEDRGPWGQLTQTERDGIAKTHPWGTDTSRIPVSTPTLEASA